MKPGDRIGSYEIVARLSSGGMATLFLGRRTGAAGFARPVAIKMIHRNLADDPAFVQMFVEEALLSSRIQHPNVVHVEELIESDETYFLAMEYVDGCSIARLFRTLRERQQGISPEIAVAIAMRAADGLHAAHELAGDDGALLGVVHRDVTPHNLLVSWRGEVKLIDFGIAKAAGRAQRTRTGFIRGSLGYMPPEQAHGEEIDRRADIYALGVILWELLTMRRMFEADNDLALLKKVQTPEVTPPSAFAPHIAPGLDAAVMAALAPARGDRPSTARQLRQSLAEAMPEALTVDHDRIAELMSDAMAEVRAAERSRQSDPPESAPPQRTAATTAVLQSYSDEQSLPVHLPADPSAPRRRVPAALWIGLSLAVLTIAGLITFGVLGDGSRATRPTVLARPSAAPSTHRERPASPVPDEEHAPAARTATPSAAIAPPRVEATEARSGDRAAEPRATAPRHSAPTQRRARASRRRHAPPSAGDPALVDGVPLVSDLGM